MKAVVIEAPGEYNLQEITKPDCPDKGLLIKVLACGLCGSDLRTLRFGHRRIKLPFVIGHEVCGQIVECGANYSGIWKNGDILSVAPVVYCGKCVFCKNGESELCINYKELAQQWPGGFAEYMAIPQEAVENGSIQKVPDHMNPIHSTIVEPLSSCVNAQEKGRVGLGDVVVIIGAGPIGTLHLELARLRGADKIIMADINNNRLELVKIYSPDYIFNSFEIDIVEEVKKITSNLGADVIITANSSPETHSIAVEMAKKGGRILIFGGVPAEKSLSCIDINKIHYNALNLMGTTIYAAHHNRTAMQLIVSGRVSAEKFITNVLPLERFNEGVQLAMEGKARRVVFVP